jgi:Na+/H+-dicarboxylate symporter
MGSDVVAKASAKGLSLSAKILIALLLGVATGLFFGERVAFLEVGGDAFIRLLQMTVLPYVVLSLITGLGGLTVADAKALLFKVGSILIVLWILALSVVVLMPLSFPNWESASFFSTSLVTEAAPIDFLGLYIPSNPFHALANNVIPSVVVFSIFLGVALIGTDRKQALLDSLERWREPWPGSLTSWSR